MNRKKAAALLTAALFGSCALCQNVLPVMAEEAAAQKAESSAAENSDAEEAEEETSSDLVEKSDFAENTEKIVMRDDNSGVLQSSVSYDDFISLWMAVEPEETEDYDYLYYAPLWYLNDDEDGTWADFYFDYIPQNKTDGCTEVSYYAGSDYYSALNSTCSHGITYNVRLSGMNNTIEDFIEDDGSVENSPEMVTVTCALASFLGFVKNSTSSAYECNLDNGNLYLDGEAVGACGTLMSNGFTNFYYYAVVQQGNAYIIWNAWPVLKDGEYLIDEDGTRFIALSVLILPADTDSLSESDQEMLNETLSFLNMEDYKDKLAEIE